ncbi:MAG: type II secretion system F family protein [Erysipelotrichaceae bacterium]|nr:type II secretion system F family protein [Erysipelotrichaceae bacterium]MDO5085832.1 type II secretion system F family protein [Erysipelotrichaceae bacterium]
MMYIGLFFVGVFVYCLVIILFGASSLRKELIHTRLSKARSISFGDDIDDENLSFSERIIKPITDSLIAWLTKVLPVSNKEQGKIADNLLKAGIKMTPAEYASLRIMLLLAGFVFGILFAILTKGLNVLAILQYGLFGFVVVYLLVQLSITSRIRKRQEAMQRQFPNFIDLLTVCVEAGLGFDQSVQYVVKEYPCELSNEFKILLRDISLGSTRKDALIKLQKRCGIDQLKSFTAAVIQADEMGISLKNILSAQSDSVRRNYRQKIEEKAHKIPIKMMLPMVAFIFPVIFIVLLGPAVILVSEQFKGYF